jgi:hypothetical protein
MLASVTRGLSRCLPCFALVLSALRGSGVFLQTSAVIHTKRQLGEFGLLAFPENTRRAKQEIAIRTDFDGTRRLLRHRRRCGSLSDGRRRNGWDCGACGRLGAHLGGGGFGQRGGFAFARLVCRRARFACCRRGLFGRRCGGTAGRRCGGFGRLSLLRHSGFFFGRRGCCRRLGDRLRRGRGSSRSSRRGNGWCGAGSPARQCSCPRG